MAPWAFNVIHPIQNMITLNNTEQLLHHQLLIWYILYKHKEVLEHSVNSFWIASQTTLYTQFGCPHRPLSILSLDYLTDQTAYLGKDPVKVTSRSLPAHFKHIPMSSLKVWTWSWLKMILFDSGYFWGLGLFLRTLIWGLGYPSKLWS